MIRIAVGIDPGLAACGLAIIVRDVQQSWRLAYSATVRTRSNMALPSRMHEIWHGMGLLPMEPFQGIALQEAIVVCEEQTGVQEGKRRTGETSASATLVQQVVGMARVRALLLGVKFIEVKPNQAKAVLSGILRTATKAQVQRAVRAVVRDCPRVMSEHESDAVAVALAGAQNADFQAMIEAGRKRR